MDRKFIKMFLFMILSALSVIMSGYEPIVMIVVSIFVIIYILTERGNGIW